MENKESEKSRLAEILGVEEDKVWGCQGSELQYSVHDGKIECCYPEDGQWYECTKAQFLIDIINHPEKIIHQPRLTPEELAICKALGAKWVCRDKNDSFVTVLSRVKPMEIVPGTYTVPDRDGCVACISPVLLPSINPGDCVSVEEQ